MHVFVHGNGSSIDDGLPYSHDRGYISPIQYWIVEVYVAVHAYFLMSLMFTSILRISLKQCSGWDSSLWLQNAWLNLVLVCYQAQRKISWCWWDDTVVVLTFLQVPIWSQLLLTKMHGHSFSIVIFRSLQPSRK